MPDVVPPMTATLSGLPTSQLDQWAFEYKWDGVRMAAFIRDGQLRLQTRNLLDATLRYPELQPIAEAIGKHDAILDGEIVALDESNRPSFSRLQRRMHLSGAVQIAKGVRDVPIFFVLFDLLYLDGRDLTNETYLERRSKLESLTMAGANWQVTSNVIGDGQGLLENAKRLSLEGIVAKRIDSQYEVGHRSANWLKIKLTRRQEFVIGGWQPQAGNESHIGALLVGYYEPMKSGELSKKLPRKLRYAGRVGSGFSHAVHKDLLKNLKRIEKPANPFLDKLPTGGPTMRFVDPKLVGEVEFRGWTDASILRQPAFKGLREDKQACEVVREG